MMDIQIGNSNYALLTGLVALCVLVTAFSLAARYRAAKQFSTANLRGWVFPVQGRIRRWVASLLLCGSLLCLVLALVDIRWGKTWREVPQKGLEVMFVLDVSRSMLAEDAAPNRLERAKQQIKDMVDEMEGDRVGLLVFAGDSKQSLPLTSHYEDFKQTLDAVGPYTVRRGGSRLGDAIAGAANGFINKTNDHRTIVVFTDGEDQESEPIRIARELFEKDRVRIFTVGLGNMEEGSRIPTEGQSNDRYVTYEGKPVWSKMNGAILKQIAKETEAVYIPAGTKNVNMADVYHRFIADVEQTEFETARINAYIARFQWFAVPALLLLLGEILLSTKDSKTRSQRHSVTTPQTSDGNLESNVVIHQAA
jgi:Ca-activated chloride channel family protein